MYSILLAAGWPIWPLLAISILGLAILIERAWYLRKKHIIRKETIELAFNANARDATNSEFLSDLSASSPIGVLLAGVLREQALGHSAEAAIEELQILAQNLWAKLDRYLGGLATIATVAPLLGLFGTVIGMIEIFGSQGGSMGGSVNAASVGATNPQQLAHGISIALYNTAFGLLIAIPALAGWRVLRAVADQRQRECEECTRQLFKKLYPNSH
ncbi:MotA/TolQ/ExbB proton channel family protein [Polynucleobacter sp. UK-FUSCHL-C3]|jgi:biopolymer transport protein ExbB|uniref:MotA/TolQ/ExbB proton channel family protein n=1 Tax=Polynucleobacter sp. UK-FUSCHL-C3 TaxID=2955208 RepID=A0AAU8A3K9_9BURK